VRQRISSLFFFVFSFSKISITWNAINFAINMAEGEHIRKFGSMQGNALIRRQMTAIPSSAEADSLVFDRRPWLSE